MKTKFVCKKILKYQDEENEFIAGGRFWREGI